MLELPALLPAALRIQSLAAADPRDFVYVSRGLKAWAMVVTRERDKAFGLAMLSGANQGKVFWMRGPAELSGLVTTWSPSEPVGIVPHGEPVASTDLRILSYQGMTAITANGLRTVFGEFNPKIPSEEDSVVDFATGTATGLDALDLVKTDWVHSVDVVLITPTVSLKLATLGKPES